MKIAAVQMVSTPSVERNLETARRLVARGRARRRDAGRRCPSTSASWASADRDKLAIAEAPGDGPIQRMLAEQRARARRLADRRHVAARVSGARSAGARSLNANLVYSPRRRRWRRATTRSTCSRYDNGRERYDESRTLAGRRARRSRSMPAACASA